MDIEKLKHDLMIEAETLCKDIYSYCLCSDCAHCDFNLDDELFLKKSLFIALCDGYALCSDNTITSYNLDKMIKELFPNFYIHLTKRELEP